MVKTLHHGMIILLSIAGIILLNVGFIFFLLGFLPTLAAYMVDDTPKKNLYKTVRACNLAGMVPTLVRLTNNLYPGAELQITMSNPSVWFVVYGAAACGWILIWLCRFAAYGFVKTSNAAKILLLERAQKELVEEWGESITQG